MSLRDTSRTAYNDIAYELGDRQAAVFSLLESPGPLTNSEIAERLGWPINTVTPRRNPLPPPSNEEGDYR